MLLLPRRLALASRTGTRGWTGIRPRLKAPGALAHHEAHHVGLLDPVAGFSVAVDVVVGPALGAGQVVIRLRAHGQMW